MAADSPDFDRADISPLVLSDEDSMGSKRKEITNNELEGSSSRKKKNKKVIHPVQLALGSILAVISSRSTVLPTPNPLV